MSARVSLLVPRPQGRSASPRLATAPLLSVLAALLLAAVGCTTTVTQGEPEKYSIKTQKQDHTFLDSKLEDLQKLAEEFPKRHDFQYGIAGVYFEQGKYRHALAHLEKAIELDSTGSQAKYHYHLGRTYMKMGEKELATKAFRRAVELTPEGRFSGIHAALGFVNAINGELAKAEKEFRECVRIDPGVPEFYYHLAAVCDMQGKKEDAIHNFREYLERGGKQYKKKATFYLERLGIEVEQASLEEPSLDGGPAFSRHSEFEEALAPGTQRS